jgi:hypothetical protein
MIWEVELHSTTGATILVDVEVGSGMIQAVVDTACQITVFSVTAWRNLCPSPSLGEEIILKGAAVLGRMKANMARDIQLRLGGQSYFWDCCVAPISDDLILGLDFLHAQGAVVDLPQACLSLRQVSVPIKIVANGSSPSISTEFVLCRTAVIPPFSMLRVPCVGPVLPKADSLVVSSPSLVAGVYVLPCLTQNAKVVPTLFCNNSDRYVKVRPDTIVLRVEPLEAIPCVREVSDLGKDCKSSGPSSKSTVPEHVLPLLTRSTDELSSSQALELTNLLSDYGDVFAISDTDLGRFEGIKHGIDTGGTSPIRQRMRRTPLGFAEEEDKYLDSMLKHGIIRPSFLDWASPPVLVRKRDGSVRYCVDYWKLNDATKKDVFPLPLIEECIDALAGSQFFSTLDMCSGY